MSEIQPVRRARLGRRAIALCVGIGSIVAVAVMRPSGDRDDFAAAAASPSRDPRATVPIPVETGRVERRDLVTTVTARGEAQAWRRAVILALAQGVVERLSVREDDRVGAGQIVVTLDATEQRMALAEAEAALRMAQLQYREQVLFNNEIADPTVRATRDAAARTRSGLDAAELRIQRARYELARGAIAAPFAGRIADIRVTPGQAVRPGDELVSVISLDPIKVDVQVLEGTVGRLRRGQEALVEFSALPGRRITGTIQSVNPLVESGTRTARVTLRVPNPGGEILPGMYAQVSVEAQRYADRLLVPSSAIIRRDGRTLVFVLEGAEEQRRARWRYVTVGLSNESLTEVTAGPDGSLKEGGVVLVSGHANLVDNAPVAPTPRSGERP